MEAPLLLQFSIALFTGMVAATFVPPVRKSIPRTAEVALWIGFLTVCLLGVIRVTDPSARELSASLVWAGEQVLDALAGLMFGSIGAWISDHRFSIASWLLIVGGTDMFALMLIRSMRSARPWQPRVRLGEWMELPVHEPASVRANVVALDPIAVLNRRLARAGTVAGAALLAVIVHAATWYRDVLLPREAVRLTHALRAGRDCSRSRLETMRDAGAHLQFAARAWYTAAGEPVISAAIHTVAAAQRRRPGQVIDLKALLNAQAIGWYGPLGGMPNHIPEEERDAPESLQQTDRLAS